MPSPRSEALAAAFLSAETWTLPALAARGATAFAAPRSSPWLRRVAKHVLALFAAPPRAHFRELAIAIDRELAGPMPTIHTVPVPALAMGPSRWRVPELATTGDLARWLELTPPETLWFADPRGLERRACNVEALRHYRYAWVPKSSGGLRLLEIPKPRMKVIGQRILRSLLDEVPPHDAAHGFRRHRSVVTHAREHVGRDIVMRIDLSDFFLSVRAARVRAIFSALGYPSEVAWILTGLTTNIAPVVPNAAPSGATAETLRSIRHAEMLARTRHLPQGAPTSPALANLAAYALDGRLTAAASSAGAHYSRYADDLVFSGDGAFARRADRFARLVGDIVRDEGFTVNARKTRRMRRGARQSVTGVVVNERPTLGRAELERLEAILYNCVRHGPATQNRANVADFEAHLRGRVAHAKSIDQERSGRLTELFDQITWR